MPRFVYLAAVSILNTALSASASYTFTTFDAPGHVGTFLYGISGNTVVGYAYTGGAFTLSGGSFDLLVPSIHAGCRAYGISGSTVYGSYDVRNPNGLDSPLGFVETDGVFTSINATFVQLSVNGVSGNTIIGTYLDKVGLHGFTLTAGVFTSMDDPMATHDVTTPQGTHFSGISGDTIFGEYDLGNSIHGFTETNGVFTTFDCPGASKTSINGMFGDTIVGSCVIGAYVHGFIESDGQFTILDDPDANDSAGGTGTTAIYGIDDTTLVGYFTDIKGHHGFIATLDVPEPASLLLLLPAAALLAGRRKNPR